MEVADGFYHFGNLITSAEVILKPQLFVKELLEENLKN